MIRVTEVPNTTDPIVTFDRYIAFSIEWPSRWGPLYWRGGNFTRSLIEVGFDEVSGIITDVILTALVQRRPATRLSQHNVPRRPGVPRADPRQWDTTTFEDHRIDEVTPLIGEIQDGAITILLTEQVLPAYELVSGRVRCGVTEDGALCSIRVDEVTPEEYEQFSGTLPQDARINSGNKND
jgi:hypothetical protein